MGSFKSKVTSEWVLTCANMRPWRFYSAAPLGDRTTNHDLWVTLSWHWANQPLPYPINIKHLAREWQVSMFKSSIWVRIPLSTKTRDRCSTLDMYVCSYVCICINIFICVYVHVCFYVCICVCLDVDIKTSLSNHLHIPTTPLYRAPIQYCPNDIQTP